MDCKLTQSMEDYLEAIYILELDRGNVRVKDIATKMEITMPSVTSALRNLEKHGFVSHPRYDFVLLTPKGAQIAENIYHRHQIISRFLSQILGLDAEVADRDACHMEHHISPETLERLVVFISQEMDEK